MTETAGSRRASGIKPGPPWGTNYTAPVRHQDDSTRGEATLAGYYSYSGEWIFAVRLALVYAWIWF